MNSLFTFVSVYKNIKMLIINYHYRNSDKLLNILSIVNCFICLIVNLEIVLPCE